MLKNNQGFICQGCNKTISKAVKTCRNHCPYCFLSVHVDESTPGDRKSHCQEKMIPVSYIKANGIIKIKFCCVTCGKIHYNKIADDDQFGNLDLMIEKRLGTFPNLLQ